MLSVKTVFMQRKPDDNDDENIQYTLNDENEMLLSSSRDTSLKLWELETQHCVQTIVGHKFSLYSFTLMINIDHPIRVSMQ